MKSENEAQKERVFWHIFRMSGAPQVTDEDLVYFRDHPDEVDEVTAPVNVHKLFLWAGAPLLGFVLVAASKVLDYGHLLDPASAGVSEFVNDIVFEIGAAVTAYLLGILLNRQQENAAAWRTAIRRRIEQGETS